MIKCAFADEHFRRWRSRKCGATARALYCGRTGGSTLLALQTRPHCQEAPYGASFERALCHRVRRTGILFLGAILQCVRKERGGEQTPSVWALAQLFTQSFSTRRYVVRALRGRRRAVGVTGQHGQFAAPLEATVGEALCTKFCTHRLFVGRLLGGWTLQATSKSPSHVGLVRHSVVNFPYVSVYAKAPSVI